MSHPNSQTFPSEGCLLILSAPSGTGKTTLCRIIKQRFPELVYSVSYTTRPPRSGEIDGVDYFFIDKAEFQKKITAGQWAEFAEVHGNYYGTSAVLLDHHLQKGDCILLDIDVAGTRQILQRYPDSMTIFIMPPSMPELRHRLERRGTDSPETIEKRLKNAESEIAAKGLYRHVIVNDRLEDAVKNLSSLIKSCLQRHRSISR